MKSIFLNKKISRRVEMGHPWIFGNEVNTGKALDAAAAPGEIVNVYTFDKKFIGRGYINPKSQIMVRLLTRDKDEVIDDNFFFNRIKKAWAYRQQIGYTENCRLIFGEADDLPQLIIDKFNDYFVIQTLALGIDIWKPAIVKAIEKIFSPLGIYERNDVPIRELEGMEQKKGFLSAGFDTNIIINENGIRFYVDIANGQKTGFFLDQQDNRRAIQHIVKDADVLGAFCYTGSFEISAAKYGARSVLGLDISQQAVDMCIRNAALNELERTCTFSCVNAFDVLKEWSKEGKQWDVVMLDPPSFTKSRATIDKAVAGYKEINLRGMKLVKPGGFLVTSSCTNLVQPELFLDIIQMAATDAKRKIRQVVFQSQSADHPIIRGQENTHYLKFLIVQVM
ncbi:MAG: class I SAM-dependent rRNA methyltransferase [Chitinophagaceae bacterium]|nr:class I SAM-dependent rRNA methyltransferase [Chitinophagaceae bacterium]